MRRLFNFWTLILCALAVVGCEKPAVDDGTGNGGGPDNPTPGVPPEITLTQTEVTYDTFTFEVTTNVEGELGYVVVEKEKPTPDMNTWFDTNVAEVKEKATISVESLKDNTTYTLFARLRAKADGELSTPQKLEFTTPDDGKVNPIEVDEVTYDTIEFTINIEGSYVFQCIDKAYLEYYNLTTKDYIQTAGIGISAKGVQTVEWIDGGKYGDYDMRVREDSDYYIIAAITNGSEITDQIFVAETRTPKKPQSEAGLTTELKNITSTSVTISTTPDNSVVEYYVLVKDKAWSDSIISSNGESMLATLVKYPSAGSWHLTAANEQEWGGLIPATEYYCMVVIVDNTDAEAFSKFEFKTKEATGAAPTVELSLSTPAENGHNTLSLNIFSAEAASIKVAFNTAADVALLRSQDYSDEYIINNYGTDLSAEQVEAVRTTGLSLKMEDLFPEIEYVALVSVKNDEQTATIKATTMATNAKPVPARVESELFTSLQGEWEVSYSLIQRNQVEVSIHNAPVTIAQGVDATTETKYREQNRLVVLGWPFDVDASGNLNPDLLERGFVTPADLMEADPAYWGAYPQVAYRDYGPKIFLEIGADGSVSVPSSRSEFFYNWAEEGTFYFFGADILNEFTAPASFPVTVSADGNTITIGIYNSGEEFGYGNYRPAVFRGNDPWAIATSDIVLTRVK
ncbi:MAG: hypothetical protein IJZ78_03380 [Alistipes sp.]|nr:hypothetical protein [Alistipes sp.]MBQ8204841.1 hypothetical protein [Alistipes sp.]